ncbi:MAG: aspartate aminotransferase family protein [Burkholderiaceae bacterium]|jgi:beta-alanine--pyruvate transaminase|nr:aspartate aminotransferase family protein [Burkholderiaceae bacterium]
MKLENPTTASASTEGLTLEHFWMPFTANRQFKQAPRLLAGAKDMHYTTPDGRKVLDGTAGLWCVNAGHCRAPIVEAVQKQAATMDFAPTFQMGHPLVFEAATAVARITPEGMKRVFFTNSGSESVDTAMKIALAYHRARGESSRRIIIGRERGYHGVNMGGTAVGGIPGNRKTFPALMPIVDHLRSTHDLARNAFTRGLPAHGAEFADELERIVALHDPSNVAAVIVEPVAGSTGVLLPPRGYLERLREICTRHGILLIFDEVITGFGRLGTPFAADAFGVRPDMMTVAKAINNAAIPMGAVIVDNRIHDAIIEATPVGGIELMHGYTYSGHPMAAAAVVATQKLYVDEQIFARAAAMAPYFEEAMHSLRDARHVIDVRSLGLVGGIELEPRAGAPGKRAYEAFVKCFEAGVLVRTTGDIFALSPPLIIEKAHVDQIVTTLRDVLKTVD